MRIEFSQNLNKYALEAGKAKNNDKKFSDILKQTENKQQDDKELKKVCQQLESVFIHKMISQMRSTIPKDGLIPRSSGEEMFQDMLDEQYAQKISQAGGIGLAEIIYKELSNKHKIKIDN